MWDIPADPHYRKVARDNYTQRQRVILSIFRPPEVILVSNLMGRYLISDIPEDLYTGNKVSQTSLPE